MAATLSRLDPAELDPLTCPRTQDDLPGLAAAVDDAVMGRVLGRALRPGVSPIARCRLQSMRYAPGRGCVVRYEAMTEAGATVTVTARLHPATAAARREHAERLRPLAARLGTAGSVALLPELRATVSVYPIDAGLPTLLEATDAVRAGKLLADALGRRPAHLRVTAHRYSGSDRAMLRYADAGHTVAYGKVAADGRGAGADAALASAGRALARVPADARFDVPLPLGYTAPLRLQLLGAVAGSPLLSDLLRARARGGPAPASALLDAAAGCARVAATLHRLDLAGGDRRPVGSEIARLQAGMATLAAVAPGLGAWLERGLARAEAELAATTPQPPRPCHGDLKHNQILFDGRRPALVDFDTVCVAEPALDLGHFLAYLRLKAAGAGPPGLATALADAFLEAYADAVPGAGPALSLDRVRGYEELSLLGRAVHSWQKRKPRRLTAIIGLLEDRS
jgi:aminoglycoside phosphotransferase (APT) family kinase protein